MSEGFIRAGYKPVAHVEIDKASCNTLITRAGYHYLKRNNKLNIYIDYLSRVIDREKYYSAIPSRIKNSIINKSIGSLNNQDIFRKIDDLRGNKNIDVIIGGPPCQAYSLVGRSRDKDRMIFDLRNYLFLEYAKYLEYFKPKLFVFENVTGLKSAKTSKGESYLKLMLDLFKSKGYTTEYKVLSALDFGILQNRKRIILIGRRGNEKGFYPKFENKQINAKVSDVLNDLPPINDGMGNYNYTLYNNNNCDYLFKSKIRNGLEFTTQHISRPVNEQDKMIYRLAVEKWEDENKRLSYNDLPKELKTHKNTNSFTDRFKVVASNLNYSQTVVAHISKDGHYYIHPDLNQNRSITPREAARLQSFPDDYFFEGVLDKPSRTSAFKQIGNAVPPLMAEEIAKQIKGIMDYE